MKFRRRLNHLALVAKDPRWWFFYLQRRFMGFVLRDRLAEFMAGFRPPAPGGSEASDGSAGAMEDLRVRGIAPLGRLLSEAQCDEIRGYLTDRPVRDPYRPDLPCFFPEGVGRGPHTHIAHHEPEDTLRAPGLLELANDPRLITIASRFLGCRPSIGYMAAWWSYPTPDGPQQAENFHRDVDDWRFLKLFVYLTDVGDENGPHVFVAGSPASPRLRRIRRFTDEEVVASFAEDQVLRITGRAGEGFLENTFGIHKGQPVVNGRRLIFQVVYSMFPLPYSPKRPVQTCGALDARASLDVWTNRLYVRLP